MDYSHRLIVAVVGIGLLTSACGSKEVAEAPEPVSETPMPPAPAMPASTPVVVERLDPDADAWRMTLEKQINFDLDRADLSPEARAIVAAKVGVLRSLPGLTLRIDGHADQRGSDEYNLALSNRRAAEAKRFMVQQGIDAGRLETVGYGEERPLDPGNGENAWAMNRRAGFQVTGGSVSQR
ncbi:MAG: OmpA family protein [Gemmatimonadales bacterium]|nr:OmpA family protein [Gemmatimonadales bacterium]